jgi:hypothetical protein
MDAEQGDRWMPTRVILDTDIGTDPDDALDVDGKRASEFTLSRVAR